jgi:hypothetical protein
MIVASTVGWKTHVLPRAGEGVPARCGLCPAWGWGYVQENATLAGVRAGELCERCERSL